MQFAHANKTKIRKIRLAIGELRGDLLQLRKMVAAIEGDLDEASAKHFKDKARVTQMKGCFRKNRLAGQQWSGDDRREARRPCVMFVAPIHQRDQKPGVSNSSHPREYPFRCDKSGGPSMQPTSFIHGFSREASRASSNCARAISS